MNKLVKCHVIEYAMNASTRASTAIISPSLVLIVSPESGLRHLVKFITIFKLYIKWF